MEGGHPEKSKNVRFSYAEGTIEQGERHGINIIVADSQARSSSTDGMADHSKGGSGKLRRLPKSTRLHSMYLVGLGLEETEGTRASWGEMSGEGGSAALPTVSPVGPGDKETGETSGGKMNRKGGPAVLLAVSPVGTGDEEGAGTSGGKINKKGGSTALPAFQPVAGTSKESKVTITKPMGDKKVWWIGSSHEMNQISPKPLPKIGYPLPASRSPTPPYVSQEIPQGDSDSDNSSVVRPPCSCFSSWTPSQAAGEGNVSERWSPNMESSVLCVLAFVIFAIIFLAFLLSPKTEEKV